MNNINPLYGMMPFNDLNYNMLSQYIPANKNKMSIEDITTPQVGFIRGNMFDNLYVGYKNYKPLLPQINNEQERILNGIREYAFALNDLDLYLDTHSNNTNAINLYNSYLKEKEKLCDEYESKYGPLSLGSKYQDYNNWAWSNTVWPWEVSN